MAVPRRSSIENERVQISSMELSNKRNRHKEPWFDQRTHDFVVSTKCTRTRTETYSYIDLYCMSYTHSSNVLLEISVYESECVAVWSSSSPSSTSWSKSEGEQIKQRQILEMKQHMCFLSHGIDFFPVALSLILSIFLSHIHKNVCVCVCICAAFLVDLGDMHESTSIKSQEVLIQWIWIFECFNRIGTIW